MAFEFANKAECLPGRMSYLYNEMPATGLACPLCQEIGFVSPEKSLIVFRGKSCCVKLHPRPYANGHLLILPLHHVGKLDDLTDKENLEIMEIARLSMQILTEIFRPQRIHFGANTPTGRSSGLSEHLAFHVIPRCSGDVNFHTALGSPRELSQILQENYRHLKEHFAHRLEGVGK